MKIGDLHKGDRLFGKRIVSFGWFIANGRGWAIEVQLEDEPGIRTFRPWDEAPAELGEPAKSA